MLFWMIVKVALKSLLANKLRSVLAMLGVIIGVGAVVSMLAIAAGAKQSIMQRMTAMGTNLIVVRPAQHGTGGVMSGTQQNLVVEDAQALLVVRDVHAIAPVVGGNAQVKYLDRNSRTNVVGAAPTYLRMRNFPIERGTPFTDTDVDAQARVAVIGPVTAENLFGPEEPLGKVIKLNGINFRVIGVLKSKGDQGWYNPDDQVLIPYTTAMKQLFGLDHLREIDLEVRTGGDMTRVQEDVAALLRRRHRTQPGQEDDFNIRNQAEMLAAANDTSAIFTTLLGSIAGISLVVGGIGIMNIMLVAVTERTREIGVRKAIGAKDRDILRQFLIEASLMSVLGGLLGVGCGIGAAQIIGYFSRFYTLVQWPSIFLSLGFAAAVGIFFGFYPAWRAAQLDPIEALRYE